MEPLIGQGREGRKRIATTLGGARLASRLDELGSPQKTLTVNFQWLYIHGL